MNTTKNLYISYYLLSFSMRTYIFLCFSDRNSFDFRTQAWFGKESSVELNSDLDQAIEPRVKKKPDSLNTLKVTNLLS